MTSDWLTTEEAAAYLRHSKRTLEDWRLDGTGPKYFKAGPGRQAKVLYRRRDLDAHVEKFGRFSTSEEVDPGT